MRSPILLSILLGLTVGACGQSLAPNMTGTGGAGAGAGTGGTAYLGSGGVSLGTGGLGGNVSAACNTLVAEYQSALTAAETCQVGASGQCQQVVTGNLTGCSCPTYATDSSALTTIQKAWQAAGCEPPNPPCEIECPVALNNVCVSADGGSVGFCSYVPGTGGISGTGGDGATGGAGGASANGGACQTVAAEYASVLIGAKSCTGGATGQCAQLVSSSLSFCPTCMDYVNDSSVLDSLRQKWDALGCGNVAALCPAIACVAPASAMCVPSDAGGSVCVSSYQPGAL
jgi:hypothetical protein